MHVLGACRRAVKKTFRRMHPLLVQSLTGRFALLHDELGLGAVVLASEYFLVFLVQRGAAGFFR